jgi:hypothetical protein
MKIGQGFHIDGGSSDAFGLTAEEVAEERRAAGTPVNGLNRKRGPRAGSRRAPPVQNPFDEILKSIGLWDRVSVVCKEHGVAPFELGGTSKAQRLHTVRVKVYRMLQGLGWSSTDIGRLFDRHHTTVLDALKNADIPESSR